MNSSNNKEFAGANQVPSPNAKEQRSFQPGRLTKQEIKSLQNDKAALYEQALKLPLSEWSSPKK